MKNLAGDANCDVEIRKELKAAGIQEVQHDAPLKREVPQSVTGKLGDFTFERAWYYWVVSGAVPLAVAEKMYATPVGKKDVRVAGHCGCPPPNEWAFPSDEAVAKYLEAKGLQSINYGDLAKACNRGDVEGDRFVTTYHIDSQEGLNLFVKTLKKHNLV